MACRSANTIGSALKSFKKRLKNAKKLHLERNLDISIDFK